MAALPDYYDAYWTTGYAPSAQTVEPILGRLLNQCVAQEAHIFDIGCGNGRRIGSWAQSKGVTYTGFDLSPAAVKLANDSGFEAHVIADASELPTDGGCADVVLCSEVLEHLFDPLAAVVEARRVLRAEGWMIASVPNISHWRTRADFALLGRWHPGGDDLSVQQPWRDPHIRFFTPQTLARLFQTAGFSRVEVYGSSSGQLARVPGLRRFFKREPGKFSKKLVTWAPGFFATRLYVVATAE